MKKLTTAEFIDRAQKVHGDRYDYSKAVYVSGATKMTIICPIHGVFEQRPSNHMKGIGCSTCAGTKRLTTAEFIEKAKAIHGDKYDYSESVYGGAKQKIAIRCKKHGVFYQTSSNHMGNKRGCPRCGIEKNANAKRLTTMEFIQKATAIHGGKYDYSLAVYLGEKDKVKIICPEHGVFEQRAGAHMRNIGCPDCGGSKPLTTAEFVHRARKVHGTRYNYSKVVYVNSQTPVIIICDEHGQFKQLPGVHMKAIAGCPKCGKYIQADAIRKWTTETFIAQARNVHGDKYDYSETEFTDIREKLAIICPEHGKFEQVAYSHVNGTGCNICARPIRADKLRLTLGDFIQRAKTVHAEAYDYSKVAYKTAKDKVVIICPEHGDFQQQAGNHLEGNGCPACTLTGIKMNEPGILYYLRVEMRTHTFWKIGITNNSVDERFTGPDRKNIHVIKTWSYAQTFDAYRHEQSILNEYDADRYTGSDKPLLRGGNTELFIRDVLGLDTEYFHVPVG